MVADGYKDTVIGVIPIEWDVVNTDDVVKVGAGTGFKVDYQGCLDKPTPFYKVSDMNSLGNEVFMNRANNYVDDKDISILKAKIFPKNTLVFPKVGAALLTNKRRILSVEACVDNNIMTLVPKKDRINITFLYSHYLQIDFNDFSNDGALPSINASQVKNFKIPLPPLKEQEKIADILSTADDKIDAIATQIEKAETLKKGLLQKLLSEGIGHSEFKDSELGKIPESWGVSKLKDIFKMKSGSTPYRKNLSYFDNGTIYWIKTLDLNNGYITNSQEKITEQALAETSCSLLPINSILIAMYGGYKQIGRTGVLSIEATTNQAITALFPNDETISNFINYTLIFYRYKWKQVATSSRKDPNITKKDIENFIIPFPPLEEQKQIANILSTADEKLEVLRAKKEKYETLKKGLLQKLLSGEVRV